MFMRDVHQDDDKWQGERGELLTLEARGED